MSQNERILHDLRNGKTLDPLGVLRAYNCWSLRSRISEIEGKSGHARMLERDERIERVPVNDELTGKRYMSYRLAIVVRGAA